MKRYISLTILASLTLLFSCTFGEANTETLEPVIISRLNDLPKSVRDTLLSSQRYLYSIAVDNTIFLLTEMADDTRQIAVLDKEGSDYSLTALSAPLGKWKDYLKADIQSSSREDTLCLSFDGSSDSGTLYLYFHRMKDNTWILRQMGASLLDFDFTAWGLRDLRHTFMGHYLGGTVPNIELSVLDIADLPTVFSEAIQFINTDGWAFVNNDVQIDTLDLRTAPSVDAELIASYFSGTPVQILEDQGDWMKVSIAGVQGFMMQEFLAFGQDMLNVAHRFPSRCLIEEDAKQGVNVYAGPDITSAIVGVLRECEPWSQHILAAIDDDWYHVLCDDGLSGYVEARHFWDGNG